MVILGVILVHLFPLVKFERPVKWGEGKRFRFSAPIARSTDTRGKIYGNTHRTSSSTPVSFRHCSADRSISLALVTSNLRARRNLCRVTPHQGIRKGVGVRSWDRWIGRMNERKGVRILRVARWIEMIYSVALT